MLVQYPCTRNLNLKNAGGLTKFSTKICPNFRNNYSEWKVNCIKGRWSCIWRICSTWVFLFWSFSLDVTTCWLSMCIAAVSFIAWENYFYKGKKNQEKLNSRVDVLNVYTRLEKTDSWCFFSHFSHSRMRKKTSCFLKMSILCLSRQMKGRLQILASNHWSDINKREPHGWISVELHASASLQTTEQDLGPGDKLAPAGNQIPRLIQEMVLQVGSWVIPSLSDWKFINTHLKIIKS